MEIPAGTSQDANPGEEARPRRIELRRASIQVDETGLRRKAEYSDGSVKTAAMTWSDVRRVAAFQRDVLIKGVVCLAFTDSANVIILDEMMDGWSGLVRALPALFPGVLAEADWRIGIVNPVAAANWKVLFRSE